VTIAPVTVAMPLPGDYTDSRQYALDLLFAAYAPPALEEETASHGDNGEEWLFSADGIARLQQHVADDPRANIPDWLRGKLRESATHPKEIIVTITDQATPKIHPTNGPVHTWFGLSYTNYQVLPRTLMQSMPLEWQQRMVACLEEMHDAFQHVPQADVYDVQAGDEHMVEDLTPTQLAEQDITKTWHEDEGRTVYRNKDGQMDRCEYVFFPKPDPVPHYNRGRTYIAPAQSH
jgi:hypothetical protein